MALFSLFYGKLPRIGIGTSAYLLKQAIRAIVCLANGDYQALETVHGGLLDVNLEMTGFWKGYCLSK